MVNPIACIAAFISLAIGLPASAFTDEADPVCVAYEYRSNWFKRADEVGQTWHVPPGVVLAFLHAETGFLSTDRMTAFPGTMLISDALTLSTRPELTVSQVSDADWERFGIAFGNRYARRTNPTHIAHYFGWHIQQTSRHVGLSPDDAKGQYLAFLIGPSTFLRSGGASNTWQAEQAERFEANAVAFAEAETRCQPPELDDEEVDAPTCQTSTRFMRNLFRRNRSGTCE